MNELMNFYFEQKCTFINSYPFSLYTDHFNSINICRFSEILLTEYKEQWASDIWIKPKVWTFRMIKFEYGAENYVLYN